MTTTDGSRSISSYIACLMASRKVTCVGASLPLPPFADGGVAGAVEAFAMGYLRPFFAAVFAAGFLQFLVAGLAEDFAASGAATFATFFKMGATFLRAAFLPAPFFDFVAVSAAAALRDGLMTSSVTTSSGVSGESLSST